MVLERVSFSPLELITKKLSDTLTPYPNSKKSLGSRAGSTLACRTQSESSRWYM